MSIESMAIALHHSRARGATRLILIGIANHDGDGGAFPSKATLSKYAGDVDASTVRRSLRELEKLGEIRTHIQDGGFPSTPDWERPNRYDFLLRCPPTCDRTKNHRVTPHPSKPPMPRAADEVEPVEDEPVDNGEAYTPRGGRHPRTPNHPSTSSYG